MGTADKFAALDGLDELFPFFRCPGCKDRSANNFSLVYIITGWVPVQIDNPAKMFMGDTKNEELGDPTNVSIHCANCGHNFSIPEGWTWKVT